jgi:succinate dehydrogenase / fumarate reductase cytochrome b subunit
VAATVSPPNPASSRIPKGVPPLRAGQGHSFLWRRLHSLTGIVPVGAFLLEHLISNAFGTNGPNAYTAQVKFLTGLPFAFWLEVFGIYVPLAYHAGYGFWIWWRGESNANDYPWTNNWLYTVQRYTGIIVFAYIIYHTWYMRFSGIHLFEHPDAAYWKVWNEFNTKPWAFYAYIVGVVTAAWHFGYGIFLFCAKWGIVTGEKGRQRVKFVALAIAAVLMWIGIASAFAFKNPDPKYNFDPNPKPEWFESSHSRIGTPAE